ncbi:MAG: radical SAM protein, partial [Oligoflexia bacterium]|nr:radical SAM protein [Oligoflexia bacterium]
LEMSYEKIIAHLQQKNPDVVGITSTTPSFDVVAELSKRIKIFKKEVALILGGPHVTALPEQSINESNADFIVIGEGELTLLELLDSISSGGSIDYNNINGIAYKENNQVIVNPKRELIKNLDIIPFPDREKMPFHLYYSPPTKALGLGQVVTMLTSRGCPFSCNYCISGVMWGEGNVRFRSAESVLEEMHYCIKNYNAREFNFHDDLFTANKERLIKICEGIIERGWDIGWICMARVEFVDEEKIVIMKRAGLSKIAFGIESGSKTLLQNMNKRINYEKIQQAFDLCKKHKIKSGASFMIGYFGENAQTVSETISLMKKLNPDTVSIFQASPYPGTKFYQEAKEKKLIRNDCKWEDYALITKSRSVIDLPTMSATQIRYWIRKSYRSFYLRPKYIYKKMKGLSSISDLKNLYGGLKILLKLG